VGSNAETTLMMLKFIAALSGLVLASTVAVAQYNGSVVTPMPKNQTTGQSNTLNSGTGHPGVGPTGAPIGTGTMPNQSPNPTPPPPPSSGSFAPPRR
jgi:hypothetical protein